MSSSSQIWCVPLPPKRQRQQGKSRRGPVRAWYYAKLGRGDEGACNSKDENLEDHRTPRAAHVQSVLLYAAAPRFAQHHTTETLGVACGREIGCHRALLPSTNACEESTEITNMSNLFGSGQFTCDAGENTERSHSQDGSARREHHCPGLLSTVARSRNSELLMGRTHNGHRMSIDTFSWASSSDNTGAYTYMYPDVRDELFGEQQRLEY